MTHHMNELFKQVFCSTLQYVYLYHYTLQMSNLSIITLEPTGVYNTVVIHLHA